MQYQIIVDGKTAKTEITIKKYSREADNIAREQILRHYLDEMGAQHVVIETTADEVRRHCEEGN